MWVQVFGHVSERTCGLVSGYHEHTATGTSCTGEYCSSVMVVMHVRIGRLSLEGLISPRSVEQERGVPRVKRCAQHDPITESVVNRVRVIHNVLMLLFLVVVMVMVVLRVSMHTQHTFLQTAVHVQD